MTPDIQISSYSHLKILDLDFLKRFCKKMLKIGAMNLHKLSITFVFFICLELFCFQNTPQDKCAVKIQSYRFVEKHAFLVFSIVCNI